MKIIEPSATLLARTTPCWQGTPLVDSCSDAARVIERCGRVSWKSEDKIEPGSADGFITRVVNIKKDESIAEHASATLLLVTDRYSMSQITRHRIGAYTVESTHYINYGKKYHEIEVCRPLGLVENSSEYFSWKLNAERCEEVYLSLLDKGVKHYNARHVLPGCLKTEMAITYNMRIWRYVLGIRTTPNNTIETTHVMRLAGKVLAVVCPEMFGEYK